MECWRDEGNNPLNVQQAVYELCFEWFECPISSVMLIAITRCPNCSAFKFHDVWNNRDALKQTLVSMLLIGSKQENPPVQPWHHACSQACGHVCASVGAGIHQRLIYGFLNTEQTCIKRWNTSLWKGDLAPDSGMSMPVNSSYCNAKCEWFQTDLAGNTIKPCPINRHLKVGWRQ